eukprot:1159886-Pelagomonas_calceolata.AAC.11
MVAVSKKVEAQMQNWTTNKYPNNRTLHGVHKQKWQGHHTPRHLPRPLQRFQHCLFTRTPLLLPPPLITPGGTGRSTPHTRWQTPPAPHHVGCAAAAKATGVLRLGRAAPGTAGAAALLRQHAARGCWRAAGTQPAAGLCIAWRLALCHWYPWDLQFMLLSKDGALDNGAVHATTDSTSPDNGGAVNA